MFINKVNIATMIEIEITTDKDEITSDILSIVFNCSNSKLVLEYCSAFL